MIIDVLLSGMVDGGKRAIYAPNHVQRCQRLVCSHKQAVVFISIVVCIIVIIAAAAAFSHPSRMQHGCMSTSSASNVSDDKKKKVELFQSTSGKPFPWTNIRLPDVVMPLSYELFIYPNLSTFRFDGNVTMAFSVNKQTDVLLFHVKKLKIISYQLLELSTDGHAGSTVNVIEALECVKLELFHLKLGSNILPQKVYELRVQYSGMLTDSLTGFYRSSYETKSGEKR